MFAKLALFSPNAKNFIDKAAVFAQDTIEDVGHVFNSISRYIELFQVPRVQHSPVLVAYACMKEIVEPIDICTTNHGEAPSYPLAGLGAFSPFVVSCPPDILPCMQRIRTMHGNSIIHINFFSKYLNPTFRDRISALQQAELYVLHALITFCLPIQTSLRSIPSQWSILRL